MSEQDTREKLEADIEKLCTGILAHRVEHQKEYCKLHGLQRDKNHACWSETQWLYPVILHLLDRQAEITRRECDHPNWDYCDTCDTLDEQVAEHDTSEHISLFKDSREQLEADVRSEYYGGIADEAEEIIGWLDRQRAITEREVKERVDFSLITQTANALFPDYQEQIAELTAERDELREALDACGTGTMYELWRRDHTQLKALRAALHDKSGT